MNNSYRISVVETHPQQNEHTQEVMLFYTSLHDSLTELLPKVSAGLGLSAEKSQAFLLGLKLLGEVIMTERSHPTMRELAPHFRAMMQVVKPKRPAR